VDLVRSAGSPIIPFTILGAGAIGSILSAHLARARHAVTLLAHGERAEQLRRDGVRIKGLAEFTAPVRIVENPAELDYVGVLIVAIKARGTEAALSALSHVRLDAAFSIQNGVQKNDFLIEVFGRAHTLGALANLSGELCATGEVLFTRNDGLTLGELHNELSERAAAIAQSIDRAGVRALQVPDILSREWSKFVVWAGWALLAIATRAKSWQMMCDSDAARLLVRTIHEMGSLAKRAGVDITDDSILPAATILRSSEAEAIALVVKAGFDYRQRAPEHVISSLQDFCACRPLEIGETVGGTLHRARSLGMAMPLMESLYSLAVAAERIRTLSC
jgi:2-dehydropantoate 2-reductase